MSSPLYELTASYARLLEAAEDGGDVAEQLTTLEDSLEAKGIGIARVLASLEADAAAYGTEEKRLSARRKAAEANAERLREYIRSCMSSAGIRQIKGGSFSITLASGQDRVVIVDEGKLPDEYVRVKTSREPDKRAILDAYKTTGEIVPGTQIEPTTTLRIR